MAERDELRAAAPDLAAFVDEVRRVFGEGVRVQYLRLPDGRELGKKSDGIAVTPEISVSHAEALANTKRKILR